MNTQSTDNISTTASQFTVFNGVHLHLDEGSAEDYLHLRAHQLAALAQVVASESFFCWNKGTKLTVAGLVSFLADEVDHLVPLAIREAKRAGDNPRDNREGMQRNGEERPLYSMPLHSS